MANEISVKIVDNISSNIKQIQKKLKNLPAEVHKEFVRLTPIRSGNARRKTRLQGNEIKAEYPYAKKLDEGYSPQAPDGMTKPIEAYVNKRLKQILKGK